VHRWSDGDRQRSVKTRTESKGAAARQSGGGFYLMEPKVSLASIAQRSTPLAELLAVPQAPGDLPADNSLFDRWREVFNSASDAPFLRRLASLGLSETAACLRLQTTPERPHRIETQLAQIQEAFIFPSNPVFSELAFPFVDIWSPLASFAHHQVFWSPSLFSERARLCLSQELLGELCQIAAEPLYVLFDERRANGSTFQEFVSWILSSKAEPLFRRFPSLARCVIVVVNRWIHATRLFGQRLEQDWAEIGAFFPELNSDTKVESVVAGISDHHDGGLQVMLLEFSNQQQILYKPKDMSLEAQLPRLNDWLEAEGFPFRLKFPTALDKQGYGWCEFIKAEPCRSPEEVNAFYQRAGVLLCLAHTLNGKDLLLENIVAAGGDPVPIDLETFFQPEVQRVDRIGSPVSQNPPEYLRRSSVIETGLLPAGRITGIDVLCDLSGLSGSKESLPEIRRPFWEGINSDNMRLSVSGYRAKPGSNRPSLEGVYQHPKDFEAALIEGFSRLYEFICARKESFIRFLDNFAAGQTRLIFRSTQMYGLLLKQSLRPENLIDGISRSLVFETVYRPAVKGDYLSPFLKSVLDHEVACLESLDIPRFYIRLDSNRLAVDQGQEVPHFLLEAPLETVRQRVLTMSPAVANYHIENIRESLRRRPQSSSEVQTRTAVEELINSIAHEMLSRAESNSSKNIWPQPSFFQEPLPKDERSGLYLGDIGAAVFLAAWDCVTNNRNAKPVLDTLFQQLQNHELQPETSLGICNGIGSYVYSLLLLARFTDEKRWLELTERFAAAISEQRLTSERDPDLIYGLAGAMIALTRLYEVTEDSGLLERVQHGRQVLRSRFLPGTGWIRPNGEACLGFAHGSAGIAFAAFELARVSSEESALEMANLAIALDRTYYSASEKNWPSTSQRPGNPLRAWCSGLPGIILSRIYGWHLTQDRLQQAEIEDGLRNFPTVLGLDHWCCGNLGLVEILEHASEILNRQDLHTAASSLLGKTVQRGLRSGFFRFSSNLGDNFCFQPSLFRGSAGLGYTLLRFLHPGKLPCILAFEV
jgi:type 2 lantibiotic biosynthesis protein LanM